MYIIAMVTSSKTLIVKRANFKHSNKMSTIYTLKDHAALCVGMQCGKSILMGRLSTASLGPTNTMGLKRTLFSFLFLSKLLTCQQ